MSTLLVNLNSKTKKPFDGHSVSAAYRLQVKLDDKTTVDTARETTAKVSDAGAAAVELAAKEDLVKGSQILLTVSAPDGEVLLRTEADPKLLDSGKAVEIPVEPKTYFKLQRNTDPSFVSPVKLRGFVVDPNGNGKTGNQQVLILAKPSQPANAVMAIIVSTKTDAQGYFSADYPIGKFVAAEGRVAGGPPVSISLAADNVFPEKVILGVELPKPSGKDDDCACNAEIPPDADAEDLVYSSVYSADTGGGKCVDFTKPNRVLEEFDYNLVVRTTQPDIRGITITEPPKVRLNDVIRIVQPEIATLALRSDNLAIAAGNVAGVPASRAEILRSPRPPAGDARSGAASVNAKDQVMIEAREVNRLELEHLKEAVSLTLLKEAQTKPAGSGSEPSAHLDQNLQLETEIVRTLATDPDGFTLTKLASAEMLTKKNDLIRILDLIKNREAKRGELTCRNPVDWDLEPTFYQACTIAHGHILHMKQEWRANGYSLGDLVYSLPLAPCQKKQIAIIDWDRKESASRRESLEEQEFMSAQLNRDRDIVDVASASLHESMRGGSNANTSSFGVGLGIGAIVGPVGGLFGIGGGSSNANSTAWQNSSRDSAAHSMQSLSDSVSQSASAVRSQRSTVVQTVNQGETMRVETDVVANHNHCHSLTMEYFEVLRHFIVRHYLADVQECLLVTLLISRFDSAKARRWRECLSRYLRNRELQRGFDALQRIADNYVGSDMPVGAYAEEDIQYLDGYFRIQFRIQRPRDNSDGTFLDASWTVLSWLGISPLEFWNSYLAGQAQRDRIFAEMLGPRIAQDITNGLRIYAVDENDNETQLPIDLTLVSDFKNDQPLYVSLRVNASIPPLRRDRIKFIRIDTIVDTPAGAKNIDDILPVGSKIIVSSGQMGYRTAHIAHDLFNSSRILNDLSGTDGVMIYTPLSRLELRRPRDEDKEYANALLKHLNDHIEHYHRAIWWSMDAQRRYMLLDGFLAPNANGRSVASVVENRLIGIIGNCLVMPVSAGFHLDTSFEQDTENPIDLLEHYQPTTPVAPKRIAIPTKGVYAEAVMGACNACEKKDDTRFWRWEESPCPDDPTPINPISTDSRRADPPDLTAKDFPQPIVAFQNVPAAPDPQGFGGLLTALSNPNLFRDITGLTENQKNALAALQSSLETAKFFGGEASKLALQGNMSKDVDRTLDRINSQHEAGAIDDQTRAKLVEEAIRGSMGGGAQTSPNPLTNDDVKDLVNTAGANDASVNVSKPTGESVSVDAKPVEGALEEGLKTRIVLPSASNTPDRRAFSPSTNDKTGVIELEAQVTNAPAGATFKWMAPDPSMYTIESPTSQRTKIKALKPGSAAIDFAVFDSSGTQIQSVKIQLSLPQFVSVTVDAAFDPILTLMQLDTHKDEILRTAKQTAEDILKTANVRLVWLSAPLSEKLPAHIPVANVTTLTLKGDPPSPGTAGSTSTIGGVGAGKLNETIEVFPGAYDDNAGVGSTHGIDVETQALILDLQSRVTSNPALEDFAVQVYGRLIGQSMSHETIHSLLGFDIPTGHNSPSIPDDIMNTGDVNSFQLRTGFEDLAHQSPVDPVNFVDHGISAMNRLQATNQGRMDVRFPVPPSFR
ncbi:MAG: hypothetical protein ABIP75_11955 [Pyrinomonadaceae bacterium]